MISKFPLDSDDCELLLEFENIPNLVHLCKKLQRDHSVIARSLKRISENHPVVEKKAGKWCLTELGKKINEISRSVISAQSAALNTTSVLRIGTNREFSSRIVGPEIIQLQKLFPETLIYILSLEKGTEEALLTGQIDIGIDCDRPFDPEISYKLVCDEPIVSVASPNFEKKYKVLIDQGKYLALPHLLCDRLYPDKVMSKPENTFNVIARFNDIATTRSACLKGYGWALLPRYSVADELMAKNLIQLSNKNYGLAKYGIRWLRQREYIKSSAQKLIDWLAHQKL